MGYGQGPVPWLAIVFAFASVALANAQTDVACADGSSCGKTWKRCGSSGGVFLPCCSDRDRCVFKGPSYSQCRPTRLALPDWPNATPVECTGGRPSDPEDTVCRGDCAATWGRCGGLKGGEEQLQRCCSKQDQCVRRNAFFAQCRPKKSGIPSKWEGAEIVKCTSSGGGGGVGGGGGGGTTGPEAFDVRLQAGGTLDASGGFQTGELQLFYQSKWQDVCQRGATYLLSLPFFRVAELSCEALGYSEGGYTAPRAYPKGNPKPADSTPNLQLGWSCTKSSEALSQCDPEDYQEEYGACSEDEVAELACITGAAPGQDGDIRLSDTVTAPATHGGYVIGRVEQRRGGWGTFCMPNVVDIADRSDAPQDFLDKAEFSSIEANILCKQAGYAAGEVVAPPPLSEAVRLRPQFERFYRACEQGDTDAIECGGAELGDDQDFYAYNEGEYCDHDKDVSVACSESTVAPGTPPTYRLYASSGPSSGAATGRLESNRGAGWGAICRESDGKVLSNAVAAAACRTLGFPGGGSVAGEAVPPGNAPSAVIRWVVVGECSGDEAALDDCTGFELRPYPSAVAARSCELDLVVACKT